VVPLSDSQMQTIRDAAKLRQQQSNPQLRFDTICSALPILFISELHGQHRYCYKKFTNVSRLMHSTSTSEDAQNVAASDRRHSARTVLPHSVSLLPQNCCLFCGKEYKYSGAKRESLSKCLTQMAESSIKVAALSKADFKILVLYRMLI